MSSPHHDCEAATRELVSDLDEKAQLALRHLLDCGACRQLAVSLCAPAGPEDYTAVWEALERKLPGLTEAVVRQREEARQLAEELLGLPEEKQERAAGTERFKSLPLGELLVADALEAMSDDVERSRRLARLAFAVVRQYAVSDRADAVAAQALALEANALRLGNDRLGAEEAFKAAAFRLTGPPGAHERGVYCRLLAQLRREQLRLDEAAALLWRASTIFREAGERQAESEALAELGLLFLAEDDTERAAQPLAQAYALLHPERAPVLVVRVALGLARCHAVRGRTEEALDLVRMAQALAAGVDEPLLATELRWLEGSVALAMEDFAAARGCFESVRRQLLERRELHPVALVSLDLAFAMARSGKAEDIHGLIHEVLAAFPASAAVEGVFQALGIFSVAATQEFDDLEAVLNESRALLRRYRRNPFAAVQVLTDRNSLPASWRRRDS